MPWPMLAAQVFRETLDFHESALRARIHFLERRCEQDIHAPFTANLEVLRNLARVALVVGLLVELNGVDE